MSAEWFFSSLEWICSVNPVWVSALADVVVALAAALAACQGIKSLSAWREEAPGRRKIEFAEDALASFYEMENLIAAARSPLISGGEITDLENEDTLKSVPRHRLSNAVPILRLRKNGEEISSFMANAFRAKALFGMEIFQAYKVLNAVLRDIQIHAEALIEDDDQAGPSADFVKNAKCIVWDGHARILKREDPVSTKVSQAVEAAEKIFGNFLGNNEKMSK